jgi:hypothetical protein
MADLHISKLKVNVNNAQGHEHRLGPIAQRAARIFAERAGRPGSRPQPGGLPHIDFSNTTDAEAAETIARAWLAAMEKPHGGA